VLLFSLLFCLVYLFCALLGFGGCCCVVVLLFVDVVVCVVDVVVVVVIVLFCFVFCMWLGFVWWRLFVVLCCGCCGCCVLCCGCCGCCVLCCYFMVDI